MVVAGVTACGGEPDEPTAPVDLPSLTRVTTAAQASASPFTEAFESAAELWDERDAYERLMDQCTTRFGSPFVPGEHYQPVYQFFDLPQPYGPVELSRVQRLGYHDPASLETGAPANPMWDGSPTPSRIVDGKGEDVPIPSAAALPEGGCTAQVTEALGGERPETAVQIAGQAFVAADKDPRWGAAVASWSSCMRDKGHAFASSVEAVEKFRSVRGAPTPDEIAVAVADVRCKDSTRQVDTVVAVLNAHESATIADHRDDFTAYARWRSAKAARVKAVLASTPAPSRRYWLDQSGTRTAAPPQIALGAS